MNYIKNHLQFIFFSLFVFTISTSISQSVGIGTNNPNSNAALHVDASNGNQGVIITRLTTTQITALTTSLTSSDQGLLIFDVSENKFKVWTGTAWEFVGYGDNLGNHVATTHIALKDHSISNDGDKEGITITDDGNVVLGVSNTNNTQVNGTLQVSSDSEISGNTTSSNFIYKSPATRVLAIPTAAWTLGTQKTAVMLGGNLNVTGISSGPSFSNIVAPINLPQNAIITAAQCYIQNSGGDIASLRLYQADNASGSFTSVSGIANIASNAWVNVDFSGTPWIVNNEKFNYFFFLEEKVPSANIVLRGCRIIYNVNTPD